MVPGIRGIWYKAVVTGFDPATGEHLVRQPANPPAHVATPCCSCAALHLQRSGMARLMSTPTSSLTGSAPQASHGRSVVMGLRHPARACKPSYAFRRPPDTVCPVAYPASFLATQLVYPGYDEGPLYRKIHLGLSHHHVGAKR